MSREYDQKTGKTKYFIPVDGRPYETTKEIHNTFYKMDWHEQYVEKRSQKKELSFEGLQAADYPIEEVLRDKQDHLDELAVTNVLIEQMLEGLEQLSEKHRWVLQELFLNGKSEVELSKETGVARTTIQSQKYSALKQMRKIMEGKNN